MSIQFKSAYRSLVKRKGFTLLNILGLAVGMTSCLLIFHYVSYERSFDNFSPVKDRIVRLSLSSYQQGKLAWSSATVYPAFGPTLKKDFPEVEDFCRLIDFESVLANPKDNIKYTETKGYYGDPAAIHMLGVEVIKGNPVEALTQPHQILLSETTARKYFGMEDAVGKRLQVRASGAAGGDLLVTGVFKDFPVNSHLMINYLVSYKTLQSQLNAQGDTSNQTETAFNWYDFYVYLKLKEGTDLQKMEAKFPAYCDRYINEREWNKKNNVKNSIAMMPLTALHLNSHLNQEAEVNGNGQSVSFLFLIAIFIIAIAWVNYINLSTARSIERAREVGVRKVMGAQRGHLIQQFLTESLLLNIVSLVVSVGAYLLLLQPFNALSGKSGMVSYAMSSTYWMLFVLLFLGGTFLSGLYPAFVLSGFQPIAVLKGLFKSSSSGVVLRQSLIIIQFVTSVVLIAGTIMVYKQLKFMRNQGIGADIDQTLVLEGAQSVNDSLYENTFQPFKAELLAINQVVNVASSTSVMGKEIYWTNGLRRLDLPDASAHTMYHIGIDYDFIPSYQMKILAGRNFSKDFKTDNRAALLTERGAEELGFADVTKAVNSRISRGRDTLTVIGVVASYHHQGLQKSLDPMIMLLRPMVRTFYSVKIHTPQTGQTLAQIETLWNKFFPADPFNYFFLDEFYDQQYKGEILFGKVFGIFAVLGILIACFGLLGLSAYNVLQRTKEIGIRKVIGATESRILLLLTKDFMRLVTIALIIAIPLSWYLMQQWLQGFAFRTEIKWWIFAWAGAIALVIAFSTVSIQAFKVIVSKPVSSLRSE